MNIRRYGSMRNVGTVFSLVFFDAGGYTSHGRGWKHAREGQSKA